ncbi:MULTISPECIES: hypothetical protein [unclassified Streptomyces]|uniref:hypothetical protein n=1 Tax=unclassified Streptomyces TaxID=2593676 RepID=UPI0004C1E68E|nr:MULTISPECIES: hypothetical protein [unclassified Streptomyces]
MVTATVFTPLFMVALLVLALIVGGFMRSLKGGFLIAALLGIPLLINHLTFSWLLAGQVVLMFAVPLFLGERNQNKRP